MNDDAKLRDEFASLRRAEEASVPSFGGVTDRARRRSNRGSWGLAVAASLALLAVMVAIVWVRHAHGSATDLTAAPMLSDWRAPTDFLLDTPGGELLHTIPGFGNDPTTRLGPIPPTPKPTPAPRAGQGHS